MKRLKGLILSLCNLSSKIFEKDQNMHYSCSASEELALKLYSSQGEVQAEKLNLTINDWYVTVPVDVGMYQSILNWIFLLIDSTRFCSG